MQLKKKIFLNVNITIKLKYHFGYEKVKDKKRE